MQRQTNVTRHILYAVITLFLLTLVVPVSTVKAASTNKKADAAFNTKLKALRGSSQSVYYGYVDITGDGIHEALVEYKPFSIGGSGQQFDVYAYKDGSVKRILSTQEYGLSKVIYYKSVGSLILYGSGHGGQWYSYYKLKSNGKYGFKVQRARTAIAGGSATNGPWSYYKNGTGASVTPISEKSFEKAVAKLETGKKKSFKAWKAFP